MRYGKEVVYDMNQDTWESLRVTDVFVKHPQELAFKPLASLISQLWGVPKDERNSKLGDVLPLEVASWLGEGNSWITLTYYNMREMKIRRFVEKGGAPNAIPDSDSGGDVDAVPERVSVPHHPTEDVFPLDHGDDEQEKAFRDLVAEELSYSPEPPYPTEWFDIGEKQTDAQELSPNDPYAEPDWNNVGFCYAEALQSHVPKWVDFKAPKCQGCGRISSDEEYGQPTGCTHCSQCDPGLIRAFNAKLKQESAPLEEWNSAVAEVARALSDRNFRPYVFCGTCDLHIAEAQDEADLYEVLETEGIICTPHDDPVIHAASQAIGLEQPCQTCTTSPCCRGCVGKAVSKVALQSRIGKACYEDRMCPGYHSFPYNSECPICVEANKLHRPHLRGSNVVPVIGSFCCDLVERRDAEEPIQYTLVGTNKMGKRRRRLRKTPVVIPMANKSEASCAKAIRAMLLKAEHFWGAAPIKRVHADRESGILTQETNLHYVGVALTTTEGQDSQANGVAEGENAILTRAARGSLNAALRELPKEAKRRASRALWPYAMVHAADMRCIDEWKKYGSNDLQSMREPRITTQDVLPFCSKVIYREGARVKPDRHENKGIHGWYLHADPWISRASKVMDAEAPYTIASHQSVGPVKKSAEDPNSWIFPEARLGLPPASTRTPDYPPSSGRKFMECSRCHKFRGMTPELFSQLCVQATPFKCEHLAKPDGSMWRCAEAEEKEVWEDHVAQGGKRPKRRVRIKPVDSQGQPKRIEDAARKVSASRWYAPLPRPQRTLTRFHLSDGKLLEIPPGEVQTRCLFLPSDKQDLWKELIKRETFDETGTELLEETVKTRGRKPRALQATVFDPAEEFTVGRDDGESQVWKWREVPKALRADLHDFRHETLGRLSRLAGIDPREIRDRQCSAFNAMLEWSSTEEAVRIDEMEDLDGDPSERIGDREVDLGEVEWTKYRKGDLSPPPDIFSFDPLRSGWHGRLPPSCSGNIMTEFVMDDGAVYSRKDYYATVYRTIADSPGLPKWKDVRVRKTYDLGPDGKSSPELICEEKVTPTDVVESTDLPPLQETVGQGESDGIIPNPVGMVHQMLKIKEAKLRPEYSATIGKEIGRMLQFQTWGPPQARTLIPDTAWIYRVNMLYGIKNAEHPERAKDKARLVLQGNLRFTKEGKLKLDRWYRTPGEFWAPASSMAGFRLVVAIGTIQGHPVETIDLDAAYLQSKVRGDVHDFLEMTPEIIEGMAPDWQILVEAARKADVEAGGTGQVVFPLLRNMYGKTTSGYNFIGDLQSDLEAIGWNRMPHCYGSFYKRCRKTGKMQVLANYVDDFAAALSPASRVDEWAAIGGPDGGKGGGGFDPPRLVDRFLGIECQYPVEGDYRYIILEQVRYVQMKVQQYEEVRKSELPLSKLKNLPTSEPPLHKDLKQEAGTRVRSALGGLMYAARGTRPDIMKACHTISRRVTRWDDDNHKFLEKVLSYCKGNDELGLSFDCRGLSDDLADWAIHVFVDSSLDVPWSQSGAIICAAPRKNNGNEGPFLVLDYSSTGQEYVKLSPAESETVGLIQAARGALRYLFSWELIAPWNSDEQDCVFVHVDNAQAQSFAERGWSSALVHVARTYACNVLWVTERIRQGLFKILHEPTKQMLVDPLTKLMQPLQLVERNVLVGVSPAPVKE